LPGRDFFRETGYIARRFKDNMGARGLFSRRFQELEQEAQKVKVVPGGFGEIVDAGPWQRWATSVLNLLQLALGEKTAHYQNFQRLYSKFQWDPGELEQAKGIFGAAKADYEGGYVFSLESALSGEVLGDFVMLAESALAEGHKDVAAVLACAALEDALKRYATREGLDVANKDMSSVIAALKGAGLVAGSQKTFLDKMPGIRDRAMHANWNEVTPENVGAVIGFVQQFILTHFS
jgi:hypothetical protein